MRLVGPRSGRLRNSLHFENLLHLNQLLNVSHERNFKWSITVHYNQIGKLFRNIPHFRRNGTKIIFSFKNEKASTFKMMLLFKKKIIRVKRLTVGSNEVNFQNAENYVADLGSLDALKVIC